ncbi:MAG TPA: hypothetical protein VLU46_04160 [Thermoanaerobaculia bacterium]|nr:hypothetical protein [Thermoanaerobaculia bacterium]
MTRLVWFVLKDGRSVVAGCGSATRDSIASAIAMPGTTITFTSDDGIEEIPGSAVREFVLFDSRSALPPTSAIYRLVHV